jgi:hypothetical protein
MAKLEGGREIKGIDLLRNRLGDLRMAVAQPRGPQAGVAIKNLPAAIIRKPHILRCHDNARVTLELPVAGVGHPVGFKG